MNESNKPPLLDHPPGQVTSRRPAPESAEAPESAGQMVTKAEHTPLVSLAALPVELAWGMVQTAAADAVAGGCRIWLLGRDQEGRYWFDTSNRDHLGVPSIMPDTVRLEHAANQEEIGAGLVSMTRLDGRSVYASGIPDAVLRFALGGSS